jgi:hypothetical protein
MPRAERLLLTQQFQEGFFALLWGNGFYEPEGAGLKRPVLLFAENVKNTGGGTPL